jgi:hypothetical protein
MSHVKTRRKNNNQTIPARSRNKKTGQLAS